MKNFLALITAVALVFSNTTLGLAASSQTVTIKITINHSKDIQVGGSADLTLNPGDTAVGGAITVKNIGTGIPLTIKLNNVSTLPTGWTLKFLFTATNTKPELTDTNWKDAANIEEALPYDVTKYLWMKLGVPSPVDVAAKDITMTIEAE